MNGGPLDLRSKRIDPHIVGDDAGGPRRIALHQSGDGAGHGGLDPPAHLAHQGAQLLELVVEHAQSMRRSLHSILPRAPGA